MMLSSDTKIVLGVIAAAIVVVLGGFEMLQSHDAQIRADAVRSAQQAVIATNQKQIDDAKAASAQTAAELKAQIAALEAQKQQPVTPEQFIAGLRKLTALPQTPVVVQVPAAPASKADGSTATRSPAPQTAVQIPAADLPALRNYKLACDQADAELAACKLTEANDQVQIRAQQSQLQATNTELAAQRTAAKGGSFLHRLKGDLKCLALSGAAAGAGAYAYQKNPSLGAMAGVVGGQLACRLF